MRDLQYMIDVMTAARNGKQIQIKHKSGSHWDNCFGQAVVWDWYKMDYRIAPEPRKAREWTLAFRPDGSVFETLPVGSVFPTITVREVLPE
jgi:hypothetical protein